MSIKLSKMEISPALSDYAYLSEHVGNLSHGDIYLIGVARAKTKCPLAKLINLMLICKEEQREAVREYFWEGDIESAQSLVSEEDLQEMPQLVKMESLSDRLKLTLERNSSFPDTVEISGESYAKNTITGEIMNPIDAEKYSAHLEEKLKHLEDRSAPSVNETDTCPICYEPVDLNTIPLENCKHSFHHECLTEHI
jgi:hypothetical protein